MKSIAIIILLVCSCFDLRAQQQPLSFVPGDSIQVVFKNSLIKYGTYWGQDSSNIFLYEMYRFDTSTFAINSIHSIQLIKRTLLPNTHQNNPSVADSVLSSWVLISRGKREWVQAELIEYNRFFIKLRAEDDVGFKISRNHLIRIDSISQPINSDLDIRKFKNNPYVYALTPSSRLPKSGEAHYHNTYLALNSIGVGLTDHISINAGAEIFSVLFDKPLYYVMPRVGTKLSDQVYASAGVLHVGRANTSMSYVMATLGLTIGNKEQNLSLQVAQDLERRDGFVLSVSGYIRVAPYSGIVSETTVSSGSTFVPQFLTINAIRVIRKKWHVDLGTAQVFIPYISFGYRFLK
jgi:hypothetical protein